MSFHQKWPALQRHLQANNTAELAIRIFESHYRQLSAGEENCIREEEIEAVDNLPDLEHLPAELEQLGNEAMGQAVMLKLNGGLGTSMGLEGPKSLLPLRDGKSFLDLIVAQTSVLHVPLLLMNSFATHDATETSLEPHRAAAGGQRFMNFVQHRVPKLRTDDLTPVSWEQQPELSWCPPGHGDLYAALQTSGTLKQLLAEGYRWLFVSNADNLGATLHPRLLGYLIEHKHSFLMEVADRTPADSKGGHLARRADGTLLLREKAQCHAADADQFQAIEKHRYFNTNNLWLDLHALAHELEQQQGILPLSLIVNQKTVDPVDGTSTAVYQLETAMGSAISCLPNSAAVRVPRSRFAPVKTTGDLLAVRSDAYRVDENYAVQLIAERNGIPPHVTLDDRYYKTISGLETLVPTSPSLRDCVSLKVEGPLLLNAEVQCSGNVELVNLTQETYTVPPGKYTGRREFP